MKNPELPLSALARAVTKRLRLLLLGGAFLTLAVPVFGQPAVHVPMVRPSFNPVRVSPQPAINPSIAIHNVQIPRASVNVPKIDIGPSSYYAGYPYGYVPYNSRFFYPPYSGNSTSSIAGQTPHVAGTQQARPGGVSGSLLGSTPRHNFQYDDSKVLAVQTALRRLGYYTGPLDGILGPDTQSALENYQASKKQAVSGFIDRQTLSTLGIISN